MQKTKINKYEAKYQHKARYILYHILGLAKYKIFARCHINCSPQKKDIRLYAYDINSFNTYVNNDSVTWYLRIVFISIKRNGGNVENKFLIETLHKLRQNKLRLHKADLAPQNKRFLYLNCIAKFILRKLSTIIIHLLVFIVY